MKMNIMHLKETLKTQRTLKLVISVLILLFLFKFINFNLLSNSLKNLNGLFLIVLILIPFNILLRAWRLMIILNKDGTLNLFLPASSGDIAKSYYGYRWHGIKEEMLSSSIFDKCMALLSVFVVGGIAAIFMKLYIMSFFALLISVVFLSLFFYPKMMPWNVLNKILVTFTKVSLDENKLNESFNVRNEIKLKSLIISVLGCFLSYFQLYLLCLSLSVNIAFIYILAIAPVMILASLFPFTFNGLGSGEAVAIYFFGLVGISPTLSILISLLSQVINAVIPGLFGFLIIMKK